MQCKFTRKAVVLCFTTVTYRGRQSGCKGHLQVPFQTQKSRNQDEDLRDLREHSPMLWIERQGSVYTTHQDNSS